MRLLVALALGALAAPQCEFEVDGGLCVNGGQEVLPPASTGLAGSWTFDHASPFDASGNRNDAEGEVLAGPPHAGRGSSGLFEQSFVLVPGEGGLPLGAFTYTFWLFLLHHPREAASETWCPLLLKGSMRDNAHGPSIAYSAATGHLRVAVSTAGGVETLVSHARPRRRWTHVAVVRDAASLRLFVNGVPDASVPVLGGAVANEFPLYLGGDPWSQKTCFLKLYLDDVKAYGRPLDAGELVAEAGPGSAAFLQLGCADCSAQQALRACPQTHRLCSALDLHAGALATAAAIGWVEPSDAVWSPAEAQAATAAERRWALCCQV